MEMFVAALMVVTCAGFVALPFLSGAGAELESGETVSEVGLRDAARQKSEAYAVIKEAEFDREMGKMSDDDFQLVRNKYAGQALAAIAVLEAEVPVATRLARRTGRIAFCPQCGTAVNKRANFCAGCGKSLKQLAA